MPSATGKPFKSGGASTLGLFSQAYGHFEASIRMPHQNGMWPAFWLLPANGTWPPEIDVVEFIAFPNGQTVTDANHAPWFGENPATTLHWGTLPNTFQATAGMDYGIDATNEFEPFSQTFHTYAIDWRPGLVNFLLDGKPIFCSTQAAAVPTVPMYMILNDAVSNGTASAPGWAGYVPPNATWPQNMDIAYVRVSQFNDLMPKPAVVTPVAPVSAPVVTAPTPAPVVAPVVPAPVTSAPVYGKVGSDEAKAFASLTATDPGLCSAGTSANFTATASGWNWSCVGSGSTDTTGLAFLAH